jgi:hypothetical protein
MGRGAVSPKGRGDKGARRKGLRKAIELAKR